MKLGQRISSRVTAVIPTGRSRRLAAGVITGVLTKGTAFAMTLLMVPMALGYLGPERYGVWVTMISMLAWLSLMDLGIANGLTPALSEAFGKKREDLAREYVATAIWSLTAIAVMVGVVLAGTWRIIDWGYLFNVQEVGLIRDISVAMALAAGLFLVQLPLAVNQRILLAYQEGVVANLCQLSTSAAGLIGIYLATRTEGGLAYLVLGYLGFQVAVALAIMAWLFAFSKPELRPLLVPRIAQAKKVFSFGGLFVVMQLGALLVFQKDLPLITKFLGPEVAASYSVIWQLFLYVNIINLLLAPYLAPAFGEASAVGDVRWLRIAFFRYLGGSLACVLLATLLIGVFYRDILEFWIGGVVIPTPTTVLWLGLWTIISAFISPSTALLQGVGRLKYFTVMYFTASISGFLLSLLLIPRVGMHGGIMASTICFAVILVWPTAREIRKCLATTSACL